MPPRAFVLPWARALALALLLAGCGGPEADAPSPSRAGPPVVATTFYPTTYFAERIGGDLVRVVCPLPPGEDPIFWKPDEVAIGTYQAADLVVVNGAEFEKWVAWTTLPPSRVVDTARPFAEAFLTFPDAVEHRHGPSGMHAHQGIDGHTWLDPVQAQAQAGEIAVALKRLFPAYAAEVDGRLAALRTDLDALHARLAEMTRAYRGGTILASHPAYDYLARRYGWKVVSLDLDPEAVPDAATLDAVRARLAATPARFLLWESDPTPEAAQAFAALGLTSVTVSPAETLPPEDRAAGLDYLGIWRRNLAALQAVLEGS